MAHIPHTTLQSLINDIKMEDTTNYMDVINQANTHKLEWYSVANYIKSNPIIQDNLTDNQLELLKVMKFVRGSRIRIYTPYNSKATPFEIRWESITQNINTTWGDYDLDISADDLKYVSLYTRSQWKKVNVTPSKRNVKGTKFTFAMDAFSLNVFRNNITKGFLRTEAKNLIMKVNTAFRGSSQDNNAVSIRNQFYALILDNTEVHTKAMLNELMSTYLDPTGAYYIPHQDEALVIGLGYENMNLRSVNTSDAYQTYSTDVQICTHMKLPEDSNRLNSRLGVAASIMTTMSVHTNSSVYTDLASRMLTILSANNRAKIASLTESATQLNKLIKEMK